MPNEDLFLHLSFFESFCCQTCFPRFGCFGYGWWLAICPTTTNCRSYAFVSEPWVGPGSVLLPSLPRRRCFSSLNRLQRLHRCLQKCWGKDMLYGRRGFRTGVLKVCLESSCVIGSTSCFFGMLSCGDLLKKPWCFQDEKSKSLFQSEAWLSSKKVSIMS